MDAAISVRANPFPGLRPFRENETHLFFGRENQVDAMVDKLAATNFLAVIGTSGSGKSSLVNCGLRPALRQG
jgi:putative ribosome biogenesis GTPase RsgA